MPTMRVKLNPANPALVADADAMDREPAVRRFIGGRHEATPDGGSKFVETGEEHSVSFRKEHLDAVREGHLIPCDDATAKLCGVAIGATKPAKPSSKGSE